MKTSRKFSTNLREEIFYHKVKIVHNFFTSQNYAKVFQINIIEFRNLPLSLAHRL